MENWFCYFQYLVLKFHIQEDEHTRISMRVSIYALLYVSVVQRKRCMRNESIFFVFKNKEK